MADETEQIGVLKLDLDVDALTKQAADLQKEIDKLTAAQRTLKKEGETGTAQFQKNETALRGMKKELSDTKKEIDTNIKITKTQKDSNDQLRAILSKLTKDYNSLSKEERKNTKAGQDMEKQIKSISDELKANESAVGDNRRNVGNYTESVLASLGPLGKMIGGIIKSTEAAAANSAATTGMAASNTAAAGSMGALGNAALAAAAKVKQLTIATLRFILTPLGAVLAAIALGLVALIKFFKGSQEGIEAFDKATRVVSTIVDVFVDRIILLGSALFKLLTLDFEGFAKDATAAFSGVTDEIYREVQAAIELERQLKLLEKAENDQIITGELRRAQIAELRLAAKDEGKSLQERIDLLNQALNLTKENIDVEIKLQEARIAQTLGITDQTKLQQVLNSVIEDGNQLTLDQIGLSTSTEEDRKTANEQIAQLIQLRRQSADEQRTIVSEQVSLIRRAAAERKKALEDEQRMIEQTKQSYQSLTKSFLDFEQRQLNFLKGSLSEQLKLLERQRDLELEILIDKYDKQEKELRKSTASQAAIQQGIIDLQIQHQNELTLLLAKFEQDRLEIQTASAQAASDARAAVLDQIFENSLSENEKELQANAEKYDLLYKQLVDAKLTESEFLAAERELLKQQEEQDAKIRKKQQEEQTKKDKEEADKRRQIAQAELDAKVDIANSLAQVVNDAAGEQEEAAKAISIVAASASTYAAINKTLSEPTLPYPSNIINAAVIGAQGFVNVAKIRKLEKGGVAGGKRHSDGGTKYYGEDGNVVELEKGENWYVLNRNASSMIRGLSDLNVLGGGVPFVKPSTYLEDGGVVQRQVATRVTEQLEAQDLYNAISRIQPVVSVIDIIAQQNRVAVRESIANA